MEGRRSVSNLMDLHVVPSQLRSTGRGNQVGPLRGVNRSSRGRGGSFSGQNRGRGAVGSPILGNATTFSSNAFGPATYGGIGRAGVSHSSAHELRSSPAGRAERGGHRGGRGDRGRGPPRGHGRGRGSHGQLGHQQRPPPLFGSRGHPVFAAGQIRPPHRRQGPRRSESNPKLQKLKDLAFKDGREVIMVVSNGSNWFSEVLADPAIRDDAETMRLVVRCLAIAFDMQGPDSTVSRAITFAVESKFFDALASFNLTKLKDFKDVETTGEFIANQTIVYEHILERCPGSYALNIPSAVNGAVFALQELSENGIVVDEGSADALKRVAENLADLQANEACDDDAAVHERRRRKEQDTQHMQDAPDDFRTLPIVPSVAELLQAERPFVRSNIKRGKYKDVDHYLDVQFRLMKEDFVRPLREGIGSVMNFVTKDGKLMAKHGRFEDVRVYEDASVSNVECDGNGVKMTLKFSTRNLKHVKWQITKRFLYGSLLCLTHDKFNTVMFASVVDRDPKEMAKGAIKIRPESHHKDFNTWTGKNFLVIESQAFFEAYRHFLSSLQKMKLHRYPLKSYIVDVEKRAELPAYYSTTRVGVEASGMIPLTHMTGVQLLGDVFKGTWPSPMTLGLDEAQFRAFVAGLTREFAIIQGPPGTGKTFIGLKLVQTILERRRQLGLMKEGPIFVVCYTNHALDQFLEGMEKFTKKILRVGSQCKNPALKPYMVAEMWKLYPRARGKESGEAQYKLKEEMKEIQETVARDRAVRDILSSGVGIMTRDVIASVDPHAQLPPYFSAAKWLGLYAAETDLQPLLISDNIFKQVAEHEKASVHAKLAVAQLNNDAEEDMGGRLVDEAPGADAEDLGIEDEAAFQQKLREVDSFYDEELAPVKFTGKDVLSILHSVFETSHRQLENKLGELVEEHRRLQEESGLLEKQFQAREMEISDFHHRLNLIQQQQYQIDVESWGITLTLTNLKAARSLLRVPTSFDLERPQLPHGGNIVNVPYRTKWLLYRYWANQLARTKAAAINRKMEAYSGLAVRLDESRNLSLLDLIARMDVVGMTTTGAARNVTAVQNMRAKIVVVEEAAEVLESHIVCCLSKHCEHLILIGDHQQLRPSPTVYKLAKDFNFDISLFERMLNNGVPFERLRTQHRMRPEIAALLKPHIYDDLEDYRSVFDYENVRGMQKNVFFVTHTSREESNEDLKSKSNQWEAEFLLAVCKYLLLLGYHASEITILTGYSGQLFVFKNLLRLYPECKEVRITLVDNFQGEENNIILLSLVRSNQEGNIGFLKIENRVNVALSRAKEGLFVIGNMEALCADEKSIWRKIKAVLERQQAIGPGLPLFCVNHPDQLTIASMPEQFPAHGGCEKVCKLPLKCGHMCERKCHVSDQLHVTAESMCQHPCERKCAAGDHVCPKLCGQDPCPPCEVVVTRVLKVCGHDRLMLCGEDPARVNCAIQCDARIDCGHVCARMCHVRDDGNHERYVCKKRCTQECPQKHQCSGPCYERPCPPCREDVVKELPCGHRRGVKCHEKPETVVCPEKCPKQLECGHPCPRKCSEDCSGCDVPVEKTIPGCFHTMTMACGEDPKRSDCSANCERILPCSHRCTKKCGEECEKKCGVLVKIREATKCGHVISVPCHLYSAKNQLDASDFLEFCTQICGTLLDCGHVCQGKCADCLQGRIHVPCKEPCQRRLICGHACKDQCGQNCSPCKEKCKYKCDHGPCKRQCGEPCSFCNRRCESHCKHVKCRRDCSDQCLASEKCGQPCDKKLPGCVHPCAGICGDMCPLCRECNLGKVEFFDIKLGREAAKDARFVYLKDCSHVIEVEGMDEWMRRDCGMVALRKCPRCLAPIVSSRRYKEEVKRAFQDFAEVKRNVCGEAANEGRIQLLIRSLMDPSKTSAGSLIKKAFEPESYWKLFLDELGHEPYQNLPKAGRGKRGGHHQQQAFTRPNHKKLNALEAENIARRIEVVEALAKLWQDLGDSKGLKMEMVSRLWKQAQLVAGRAMTRKRNTMTQGALKAFAGEVLRVQYLVELEKFKARRVSMGLRPSSTLSKCQDIVDELGPFGEEQEKKAARYLDRVETSLMGSVPKTAGRKERIQATPPTNLREGYWFKCTEGHIYHLPGEWTYPRTRWFSRERRTTGEFMPIEKLFTRIGVTNYTIFKLETSC